MEENPNFSYKKALSLRKLLLNYVATQRLDKIRQSDHRYPDLSVETRKAETEAWFIGLISSFVFLLSLEVGFSVSNMQSSKLKYCLIFLEKAV